MTRPLVAFDIECYKDYFLAKYKTAADNRVRSFELHSDSNLDIDAIKRILRSFTLVDFNGNNYDVAMLFYALDGATNRELKVMSDDIIVNNTRAWEVRDKYGIRVPNWFDHIDLIEIPKGIHGLKLYGARLHCPKLQDLPIEPDASIAPHQRPVLSNYCGNDLDTTLALYNYLKPQIDLRIVMSAEYGVDLRSKSDAQVAEAAIKHEIETHKKMRLYRPELPAGYKFYYKAPSYVRFETPELQDLLRKIQEIPFYLDKGGSPMLPKFIEDMVIVIGNGRYNLSIGGLHSMESSVSYWADDYMTLEDVDVTSYYPNMILNNQWFPKHMGTEFLTVYRSIVKRRIAAKRRVKELKKELEQLEAQTDRTAIENRIAEIKKELESSKAMESSGKLIINSSFGKFGSKWSTLYSPDLMLQTTITGQLSLLMLIEQFEKHGIRAVSANTDGIVTHYPKELMSVHRRCIEEWEFVTSLDMEFTEYAAIHSRDVNNYIAIKPDGETKTKGAYAKSIDGDHINIDKTPTNDICIDAVIAYLTKGVPLEDTIRNCRDIRKFLSVRNVKGGGIYVIDRLNTTACDLEKEFSVMEHGWTPYRRFKNKPDDSGLWLPPGMTGKPNAIPLAIAYTRCKNADKRQYLGKIARWVMAKGENGHIEYKTSGNRVAKTEGVRPLMDLPESFPDYLDYDRYIQEAQDILKDIGALK